MNFISLIDGSNSEYVILVPSLMLMLVVVVVDGGKTETRLFFNQVPNVIELPGIKGQRTHEGGF